jgi:hypothetical protein
MMIKIFKQSIKENMGRRKINDPYRKDRRTSEYIRKRMVSLTLAEVPIPLRAKKFNMTRKAITTGQLYTI